METRTALQRYNGASFVEGGLHKDVNATASYIIGQHGVECNSTVQLQFEVAGSTPNKEDCAVALSPDTKIEQEEKPVGPPEEGNDALRSSSLERDGFGNIEPGLHIP